MKLALPDEFDPNFHCSVCNKVLGNQKYYREHLKTTRKMILTPLRPKRSLEIAPVPTGYYLFSERDKEGQCWLDYNTPFVYPLVVGCPEFPHINLIYNAPVKITTRASPAKLMPS